MTSGLGTVSDCGVQERAVVLDDVGLVGEHEARGAAGGHDGERLVRCVQHERAAHGGGPYRRLRRRRCGIARRPLPSRAARSLLVGTTRGSSAHRRARADDRRTPYCVTSRKRRYSPDGHGQERPPPPPPGAAPCGAHWRSAVGHSDGRRATASRPNPRHEPSPATDVTSARLLRQAEHHLADDVALDLRRPGVDRAGARVEERADPAPRAVRRAGVVGLERARRAAAGRRQRLGAEDVDRQLGDLLVVLAPVQLRDRAVGTGVVAARGTGSARASRCSA